MNVLNFLKPKAKLPRNGFDLSQRHLFSAKAGQLLPVLSLECVPGDYHEINVLEMARSMMVHTDAFARMKQNFDFYFVPYSLLWPYWHNFINQNDTEMPLAFNQATRLENVPFYSLSDLLGKIHTLAGRKDLAGFDVADGALKLLDLLGYGSYQHIESTSAQYSQYEDIKVNPFRLLAYQKIFADYYRNTFYDTITFLTGDFYHVSYLADASLSVPESDSLLLHYRQWKKDFFTGLLPNMQFGDVSFVDLGNFTLTQVNGLTTGSQNLTVSGSSGLYPGVVKTPNLAAGVSSEFSSTARIDVYQILKAQALQKWKENVERAGTKLRDGYRSHYGVTPSYLDNYYCEFVGSFDAPLTIDEVVSQSTSNDSLGEIGGKGIGTANGTIKFNCKDFGVLMCIYSITPTSEYNATGLDKANTLLEHFDFWNPEFDNVGMEAVTRSQLNMLGQATAIPSAAAANLSQVLGYSPRNLHLKMAFDKVHGQFQSFEDIVASGEPSERFDGVFSHWSIPRRLIGYLGLGLKDYYINPHDLDSIFVKAADDNESSDQFIVNCNFDVKSVRNMPVLGLPNW